MTQLQWQQLEATVAGMTDEEKRRLTTLLTAPNASIPPSSTNPSLGLFADEPELVDEIMDFVYASREARQVRLGK